jgi:hypothetical protein
MDPTVHALGAKETAGMVIEQGTQRLGGADYHGPGRDVGQEHVEDGPWAVMEQRIAAFQVQASVCVTAKDGELCASDPRVRAQRQATAAGVPRITSEPHSARQDGSSRRIEQ